MMVREEVDGTIAEATTLSVDAQTIGAGIRRERRARQLTLAQVSEKTGLTIGTLSQIERGVSDPSLSSLRRIAWAFGVPMFRFLVGSEPPQVVLRRDHRRTIRSIGGEIEYQMVSEATDGESYEVMAAVVRPGVIDPPVPGGHPYEETLVVIRGRVRLTVAGHDYQLEDGDSVRIGREMPHQYANIGDDVAELLMVISPPMHSTRSRP
jgi:transcriptional regulator with XRE-family HTH domain